jgi:O-antigen/teichoic acid export membrane protein
MTQSPDVSRLTLAFHALRDKGYLHVFSTNVLLQLLGFGSVLMVAKLLAPAELALIKTAQAYAAVLVILGGVGLTAPVLRYCADANWDDDAKRAILGRTAWQVAIASVLVVLLALAAVALTFGFDRPTGRVYALYALALPALALTSLFFVYLQARQQFAQLAKNQAVIKLLSLLLVIGATYLWGLYGFVGMTIATAYGGLLPLLALTRPLRAAPRTLVLPADFSRLAGYSLFGMLISTLGQSFDFILMDMLAIDRELLGRYSLASIFLLAAMTLTGSIQTIVTPRFTAMLGDPPAFIGYLHGWLRRMLWLSSAAALLLLAGAWVLEWLFFGQKYAGFVYYLAILLIKYVLWSGFAVAGSAMLAAGIVKSGVLVAIVTTAASFLIGYPLGLRFGIVGVAWAQVAVAGLSLVLVLAVQHFEFKRLFAARS